MRKNENHAPGAKLAFLAVLAVFAMLACSCSLAPYPARPPEGSPAGLGTRSVFVSRHSWHTGLIVPAEGLERRIPQLKERFGDPPYFEVGWGDQGFYQAEKITAPLALRAMLLPSGSVVHVVAIPGDVARYFPYSKIERIDLDARDYSALADYIAGSFRKDGAGKIRSLGFGLYGDSEFYRGVGDYFILNTCNNWTAKGLKSAGMNPVTLTKATAGSVMNFIKRAHDPRITTIR